MVDRIKSQQKYKAHHAFGLEHPREMFAAIQGLRPWEKDETTLVHAVALAIREAHQLGAKGKPLPEPNYENLDETDTSAGSDPGRDITAPARLAPRARTRPTTDAAVVRRPRRSRPVASGETETTSTPVRRMRART